MEESGSSCRSCFVSSRFPGVVLSHDGRCQRCKDPAIARRWSGATSSDLPELMRLADQIRQQRKGKYDCIIGISGGLDSSYVAYIARRVMGLNPLLVFYDHGFGYQEAPNNLRKLVDALNCDIRFLNSRGGWDRKYVRSTVAALSRGNLYWGICSFCHYVLAAVTLKVAREEGITTLLTSSNMYESELWVSGRVKLKAMLRAVLVRGFIRLPLTLMHLAAARYYLCRLKLEYYVPPVWNLLRHAPRYPIQKVSLTRYVPWDVDAMQRTLRDEIGWSLPDRPNVGMRFDCMIEDGFINHTYREVTGSTVHSIIADNLIYAGVRSKEQLAEAVEYYESIILERMGQVREKCRSSD